MAVKSLQKNVPWHLQRKKKPKSLKDLTESLTEWTCKLFLSVCSPKSSKRFSHLLLMVELVLCSYIVKNVAYTEIDWQAYMEEVEGFLNGTLDYSKLQGATGPLVYPAGFVYIFSGLYHLTDGGKDVGLAQAIFTAFYLMTLVLVFRLYVASQRMPPYLFILICLLSYRIHSIFLLRLFNDCIAMLLFFASANLLVANRWLTGCLLFSSAVSVKMSVLLFAPGLLFLLLQQGYRTTLLGLTICGAWQVVLAMPFLLVNPVAYLERSFDLRRVFLYQWTVNWRFLSEKFFLDRTFHISLLGIHLALLGIFMWRIWLPLRMSVTKRDGNSVNAKLIVLFTSNLVGIVCSRSLHYQFYVWYFHTLHFLLWIMPMPNMSRILILGMIEFAWNTYPSTGLSSWILLLSHILIIGNLLRRAKSITTAVAGMAVK